MKKISFRAYDKKREIHTNYKINDDVVYFYIKNLGTWRRDDERKRFELAEWVGVDCNGKDVYSDDILTDEGNNELDSWVFMTIQYDDVDKTYYINNEYENTAEHISDCSKYYVYGNVYENEEKIILKEIENEK